MSVNIYHKKSYWKIYLAIAGIVIVAITLIYTNYLAEKLAEDELDKVHLMAETYKQINENADFDADFRYEQEVLEMAEDVPIITVDENGEISDSRNFPSNADLEAELEKIKNGGFKPIEGQGYASKIYYKHTRLFTLLTYFPYIQILLLLAFVGIGYLGFSSARKAEQNQVWVGMAKETAHQLGTPISGIMAWIENLKEEASNSPSQMEIIDELSSDVDRLNLIADRFSKIGSAPTLEKTNLYGIVEDAKNYIQKRSSRRIQFSFPENNDKINNVQINPHLFSWVLENVLRNAVDSMDGEGEISAEIYDDDNYTYVDISDTGKGIPAKDFRTVFQPGYSTKKRGWGLGLSLAKRIIENYHSGKIYVKKSQLNEGTTFTIALPAK